VQAVPDGLIVFGFLAFLVGVAWLIVTLFRRRGWKAPAIVTGLTVAVMNIGGILALSDLFGHHHSIDPYFNLYPSTPQEFVTYYLMLLGFLAVLVGFVLLIMALFRTAGRSAPAVVMGLGFVVILQAGILQLETYELPHNHAPTGWGEGEYVQTAMDSMMADQNVTTVTASTVSTDTWSDNPTGLAPSPLYPTYMPKSNTICSYCWDSSGLITRQDKSSEPCVALTDGSVSPSPCGMESEPVVGRADYGYVVLVGASAMVGVTLTGAYTLRRRKRGRHAHVNPMM